ncbi:MAG: ATP-binding protein [Clostridia bacterium]|nr:ATP-binding protein [Clostridia bacterium]
MAYRKEILHKVRQDYNQKRNRALGEAAERLAALHEKYPDLAAIDSALAKTGMSLVKEIVKGSEGIQDRVAAVRLENERLQKDRADMLVFYGFSPDYTDVKYECTQCQDTGFCGVEPCLCYKKALAKEALAYAGLARLAERQSFDTFDLKYYQGDNRAMMEKVLAFCKRYAESFHEKADSLLLIGNTGLGKTHLSTSIAVSVVEKGYEAVYTSAPNLFSALEAEKFGREAQLTMQEVLDAEFLLIDDLGTENPSALNNNFLYNIVNTRLITGKPTLINTNLMPADLMKRYTDRLASRLLGEYAVMRFVGSDIRMQKIGF